MPLTATLTPDGPRCPVCHHPLTRTRPREGAPALYTHRPHAPRCTTTGADHIALFRIAEAARALGWHVQTPTPTADLTAHRDGVGLWAFTRPGTGATTPWGRTVHLTGPRERHPLDTGTVHLDADRTVVAGCGRVRARWCPDRADCRHPAPDLAHLSPLACTGHPAIERVPLTIEAFTTGVLAGHLILAPVGPLIDADGPTVWTTPPRAAELDRAQKWAARVADDAHRRRRRWAGAGFHTVGAHRARLARLAEAARAWALDQRMGPVSLDTGAVDPGWANGAPLVDTGGRVVAVLCPVATRVRGPLRGRLSGVAVLAGSAHEAARLAAVCADGQTVVNLRGR